MKAEELMIGDWVLNTEYDTEEKITCIWYDAVDTEFANSVLLKAIEPIPITPEILEENGFIYHPLFNESKEEEPRYAFFLPRRDKRAGEDCIILSPQDEWNNDYKWGIDIEIMGHTYIQHELNYIHELQHTLRLCKINKEIKL